jgi:succinoglycan biosynthesis protein ExoA
MPAIERETPPATTITFVSLTRMRAARTTILGRWLAHALRGGTVSSVMNDSGVSVIMPVRNEERHLAEAVANVLSQDYSGELELVLAVGPSRDRTEELARALAVADPRITVVANPSGHRPHGLNLALRAASHQLLVRVDGHAMLPPGYIATAVRVLGETGAVNVGGIMAAEGVTPLQRAVAWAMTSPFGVGPARFHTGGSAGPADTVYLGAFRRDAVTGAGGYDERFLAAEDWELNHRMREAGGLIWFQPELRVAYRPRASVPSLGAQYFGYGRWRRVVGRRHAGTINLRYLAPPVVTAAILAGLAAGVAGLGGVAAGGGGTWLALMVAGFAVPVAYLLGVLAVTATAAGGTRDAAGSPGGAAGSSGGPAGAAGAADSGALSGRSLAWLPVVLVTMHVCWGLGFLTSPKRLVPADARGVLRGAAASRVGERAE